MNKLYRSNTNRVISGVCGGLSDYLSIDVNIIRILVVIASFATGFGFIAYIAATLLIPQAPVGYSENEFSGNSFSLDHSSRKTLGFIFIGVGALLTVKRIFRFDDIIITSVVLIGIGIYIILKGGDEK